MARVDPDARLTASKGGLDDKVHAQQLSEHGIEWGQDRIETDHPWLEHRAATEDQQLARESGGAPPNFEYFQKIIFQIGVDRLVLADLLECQFGVADQRGEEVVEVVRNSSGQPAKSVHLLRLPELFFEPLSFGDVAGHTQYGRSTFAPVCRRIERHHVRNDPALVAVEPDDAKLQSARRTTTDRMVYFNETTAIVGMHEIDDRPADNL